MRLHYTLALLTGLAISAPAPAEERISTGQPFAKGDIFVAATLMDDPDDDHAGTGRIIQYDADLNEKGVIWVTGTNHKIGGLTFAPDGTLWGFAQLTPAVLEIGTDGQQKPVRRFSNRSYSSVTFGSDGSLYFGEHLDGTQTFVPGLTTTFRTLPGSDRVGDGNVYRHSPDGELQQVYETATDGPYEFLAVTSTVLSKDERTMFYLSENGSTIKRYDLAEDRQLPDLVTIEKSAEAPMLLVMTVMPDGHLLLGAAKSVLVVDDKDGRLLHRLPLEGMGWAAVAPGSDKHTAIVGNFFTGEVVKVDLHEEKVLARANIGQQKSLSGVAQYPGP